MINVDLYLAWAIIIYSFIALFEGVNKVKIRGFMIVSVILGCSLLFVFGIFVHGKRTNLPLLLIGGFSLLLIPSLIYDTVYKKWQVRRYIIQVLFATIQIIYFIITK